jgi:hypothetical protein
VVVKTFRLEDSLAIQKAFQYLDPVPHEMFGEVLRGNQRVKAFFDVPQVVISTMRLTVPGDQTLERANGVSQAKANPRRMPCANRLPGLQRR